MFHDRNRIFFCPVLFLIVMMLCFTACSAGGGQAGGNQTEDAGQTAASLNETDLIDGFLVSDNISVQSLETLDLGFVYTDHNPVLLRCTLKKD